MAQNVTLGGDRLGSGNKQKVELHNYGMTSFNLEQDWKSSMAPGILYPFLKLVGTNHGTFDIDLDSFIRSLPTKGPLFGQFKFQADIFCVPIRLYQGILHNNPVGIGLKMNQVYLPKIKPQSKQMSYSSQPKVKGSNFYNQQINESSLMKYLGLSGMGLRTERQSPLDTYITRKINAVPFLAYYDIFKCYYSNKQEENAYVIEPTNIGPFENSIKEVYKKRAYFPSVDPFYGWWEKVEETSILIEDQKAAEYKIITEEPVKDLEHLGINTIASPSGRTGLVTVVELIGDDQAEITQNNKEIIITITATQAHAIIGDYGGNDDEFIMLKPDVEAENTDLLTSNIKLSPFKLQNIDDMRNALLSSNELGSEFVIGEGGDWDLDSGSDETGLPYSTLFKRDESTGIGYNAFIDNGLVVKTYQSDLFNNWLNTEYIDGESGISALTAVAVSDGSFTIDSLNLAEKIYEVLNRVAVSGGTYEDWQEAVYGEGAVRKAETPMYIGGMAAEVMFEEVISTAETDLASGEGYQPLGSLGGKGTQVGKRGGNNIHIKCEEPCYIIGIASLTPRICYSQGNDWDLTELDTLDDLHKPALDGIGFQDLIVEQMAWWNTLIGNDGTVKQRSSAGKQTAWINYQTAIDKCYGDFARQEGYAFMVLNRNYEYDPNGDAGSVKDITTYIDPSKYNYAFAYTDLASQNFWAQIHSRITARRKMGAQQIPNL